jgi:hypothetical protein
VLAFVAEGALEVLADDAVPLRTKKGEAKRANKSGEIALNATTNTGAW